MRFFLDDLLPWIILLIKTHKENTVKDEVMIASSAHRFTIGGVELNMARYNHGICSSIFSSFCFCSCLGVVLLSLLMTSSALLSRQER